MTVGLCRAVGRSFRKWASEQRSEETGCEAPELYEGSTTQAVVRASVGAGSGCVLHGMTDLKVGLMGLEPRKTHRKAMPTDLEGSPGQIPMDLRDNREDFLRFLLRKLGSHGKL